MDLRYIIIKKICMLYVANVFNFSYRFYCEGFNQFFQLEELSKPIN